MTTTVFANALVYDGTTALPRQTDIAVENGRITALGEGLAGDEVIDCTGQWISPGFFDCHVHLMSEGVDTLKALQTPFSLSFYKAISNMQRTLDTGVTSVRDASGADLGVQTAVETGVINGPRMQIAISMLSQTGGHGDGWHVCGATVNYAEAHPGRPNAVVDGPVEIRRKTRELIRAGANVIKMATSGGVLSPRDDPRHGHFRDDEIAEVVAEAEAAGIFVMSHAQGTDGIKSAIRNGVRSIEHGIYLDDEAIAMMIEHGTWLVPTLHAPRAVLAAAEAGSSMPQNVIDKARSVRETHDESFKRAMEAGVKIAMGTDCGVGIHGTNLDELDYMTRLGMSPVAALHATTGSAAELLGVADDRGTIEVGKRADLVVLDGSWEDLTGLGGRIRGVYMDGVKVSSGASK